MIGLMSEIEIAQMTLIAWQRDLSKAQPTSQRATLAKKKISKWEKKVNSLLTSPR